MTFGINGAELIILIILAVLVLGPEKLPEYTRKLTEWIRNLRRMAEGAKVQFKDETGTDFDEIDWRRYDPRQYDPRRIIREALADPVDDPGASGGGSGPEPGTREVLRKDLGTVRSERDALREDLKEMDPRALFFGSASARRGSSPTPAVTDGTDGTDSAVEGIQPGEVPPTEDPAETEAEADSMTESRPAPFDPEAT